MGSWSVYCGISNISIVSGQKCVLLPLKENVGYDYHKWQPATLPIFGNYNDYGGINSIVEDNNTKSIEKYFGVTISEFCEFFVDGKFTYYRSNAKQIENKIKHLDEIKDWRFMWIDHNVYEFMVKDINEHDLGYMDYGTPEMLKLFGFEHVEDAVCSNYDPKRFKQLWRNDDGVEMYSDGRTLLSTDNNFLYHFGKNNQNSIETYFIIPNELQYLRTTTKSEAWRMMGEINARRELGHVFGNRYEFDRSPLDDLVKSLREKMTEEELAKLPPEQPKKFYWSYYNHLLRYGDSIAQLGNVIKNLYPMSGQLTPYVLYLTPQCGEFSLHQKLLDKFGEINRKYVLEHDD